MKLRKSVRHRLRSVQNARRKGVRRPVREPSCRAQARGSHANRQPFAQQAQRQVHVLVVREVRALERSAGGARGLERLAAVERRRRGDARDLEGLARRDRRVRARKDRHGLPAVVPLEARGVDLPPVLGQDEPLDGGQPAVELEPRGQPRDVVRLDDGVVVEQQHERRARARDALVGRAGKTEVAGKRDHARGRSFPPDPRALAGVGTVVHDEQGERHALPGARGRPERPEKGVAAVAVDHDGVHVGKVRGAAQTLEG